MCSYIFMGYTVWCKDKYNSARHILMDYGHIKILLQGNGSVKSIIIKKRYANQITFERTSVYFNIEGIWSI